MRNYVSRSSSPLRGKRDPVIVHHSWEAPQRAYSPVPRSPAERQSMMTRLWEIVDGETSQEH